MKRLLCTALTALVLVGAVSASAAQQPSSGLTLTPGVLSIGMEIGYPPFEYLDVDGKTPIGFDVEMAKALAAKLNLTPNFIDTAWDGIFAGVETGRYDCIISAVTVTEERLRIHNFTKPYIGNAQVMVLLKGSTITARTPQETSGLGVSYQAETTSDIFMADLAAQGVNFTPYEYDKVMNCFDELRLGRVDVIVCDSLVAFDYTKTEDSPFEIVWEGEADETFGICLKKSNAALTAALDKALDELFADGTMQKISTDVFGRDMVSNVRN
ncbi:MAG: ABC transporter substrate-binding protein [Treponema sp.]|jgi:polar amino acid transport system substrate-binding protein|nr:ABC transporter substrate-binding protein [Treponema sp.]